MKLTRFLAPDTVTIDAAHGEHYHTHTHVENALDASYRTARDKKEQEIARRACVDADFRHFLDSMKWHEYEDWLDAKCGKRPGRQKYKNEYNRNKSAEKRRHGGVREQVIPEGMITIDAAAALLECSYRSARWYMTNGARRHGQHVRLRYEKHGKLNLTRPEWVAEFRREAFWLAIDKAARGIMAKQGEST